MASSTGDAAVIVDISQKLQATEAKRSLMKEHRQPPKSFLVRLRVGRDVARVYVPKSTATRRFRVKDTKVKFLDWFNKVLRDFLLNQEENEHLWFLYLGCTLQRSSVSGGNLCQGSTPKTFKLFQRFNPPNTS